MCFLTESATITGFECGFGQAAALSPLNLLMVCSNGLYRTTLTPGCQPDPGAESTEATNRN